MAWIVVDLDETLISDDGMNGPMPVPGAPESIQQLVAEGHRVTVQTSRFAPMPASEKDRLKQQIEEDLQSYGFPPIEVWTGTTKPDADVFIGHNHITYDGDWGLVMAQTEMMLTEMGLQPAQPPGADQLADDQGLQEPPTEGPADDGSGS